MIRPERWNEPYEIKSDICEPLEYADCSGPTAWHENGVNYIIPPYSLSSPHTAVIGGTGVGKTEGILKPLVTNVALKHESLICTDPKGELLEECYWAFADDYQFFVFDFRDPANSPTKLNILSPMYRLYKSPNLKDKEYSDKLIDEFVNGLIPSNTTDERYWTDSGRNNIHGHLLLNFEVAKTDDEVNFRNIVRTLEQSEIKRGSATEIKAVYDALQSDSEAKRFLSSYVSCHAEDTRGCIHSITMTAVNAFSKSSGLMSMICDGEFDYLNIDYDRPFALFFKTPDETNNDKSILAILISEITQHLIRVAQLRGGRLKIPTTVILDELGSIGKGIPSLCNLAVASRSRNIRLCLCLQDYSQLESLYSKSIAETIYSCIGTTFLFSSNNFQSLSQWAERVGDRQVETENGLARQPLITPVQLAAMPRGTCLCMVDRHYKFITHLPLYKNMYVNAGCRTPIFKPDIIKRKRKNLDLNEMATRLKEKQTTSENSLSWLKDHKDKEKGLKNKSDEKQCWRIDPRDVFPDGLHDDTPLSSDKSLDEIIEELSKQIEEIEAQKKKKKERQDASSGVVVLVTCEVSKIPTVSKIICLHTKLSSKEVKKKLREEQSIRIVLSNSIDASMLVSEVVEAGGCAWFDAR